MKTSEEVKNHIEKHLWYFLYVNNLRSRRYAESYVLIFLKGKAYRETIVAPFSWGLSNEKYNFWDRLYFGFKKWFDSTSD